MKPAKTADPKIKHVTWRNGRPRFEPSPTLRKMGYTGEDLKADGRWMTAGEALDFSNLLVKQIEQQKRKYRIKKTGRHEPVKVPAAPALRASYPVSQLFDDWLNLVKNPGMADRAESTIRDYRQKSKVFQQHLPDVWNAEVEALTKPICIGLYDALRVHGLPTASGAMRILGIAIQWALDRGKFPDMHINPAHKLKMKTPEPRIRYATKQEMQVLVETADEMGSFDMADMFVLAVWSGQRQADRLEFQIAGRAGNRITLRQGKTKAIVSMPEAPELRKRFEAAQKRRQLAEVISPYAILNEEDWKPFTANRYRRRFEDVRRAAARKLQTLKTLRDQDFRDTAVTWLAMAGCTIPQICAITGHSFKTANDILKHYLAVNPEMADSAIAKLIIWYEDEETK
ncbi:Putative integrase for prophage CP-933U [Neorhizobium galegae bv. orientalis]|nr:Putative integrase for prophage CP-933U [Neorhizobium galegae bv. orientalis]